MSIIYGKGIYMPIYKRGIPLSKVAEGALIKIPHSNGGSSNYYLCKHNYEPELNGNGRELLLAQNIVKKVAFNPNRFGTYAESNARTEANNYASIFSDSIQKLIGKTTYEIINQKGKGITNDNNKCFLLSEIEMGGTTKLQEGTVLSNRVISKIKIAQFNDIASSWWLRTISSNKTSATVIKETGEIRSTPTNNEYGLRPCFTIPGTVIISEKPNPDTSFDLIL